MENYMLVAGLIEAHPNREVVGRTRLQRTVCLLQRVGMGTNYTFSLQSAGPYSEELQSDITTIERVGLGTEELRVVEGDIPRSVLRVKAEARNSQVDGFCSLIEKMAEADLNVLELAATYDAFRETGSDHADALRRLLAKKGSKCDSKRVEEAISLLRFIGLPAPEYVRHATL